MHPLSFSELRRNSIFFWETIHAKKYFHFCQDSDGDGWASFAQNFLSIYPSEECKFVLLKKNSRNEWALAASSNFFRHSEPSLAFHIRYFRRCALCMHLRTSKLRIYFPHLNHFSGVFASAKFMHKRKKPFAQYIKSRWILIPRTETEKRWSSFVL